APRVTAERAGARAAGNGECVKAALDASRREKLLGGGRRVSLRNLVATAVERGAVETRATERGAVETRATERRAVETRRIDGRPVQLRRHGRTAVVLDQEERHRDVHERPDEQGEGE